MKGIFQNNKRGVSLFVVLLTVIIVFISFVLPKIFSNHYVKNDIAVAVFASTTPKEVAFTPSYVKTPDSVKGIYMTSWIASRRDLRSALVKLIDETEINTLVIDIKDYSGKIVYEVTNPELKKFGSEEVRVKDLQEFIEELHKKNIYVVGRVAVFQDEYFVKHRPDLAVKTKNGLSVWKDRKGISWIDAGSREYWEYIIMIAKESRKIGFDEINFDYIRFPSDGNMQDISFPLSSTTPKHLVMKEFFQYLDTELDGTGLKTSADLFGMVTTAKDDMGIGQLLEDALPHFDYIMPMVYPSHYPATFQGYKNPADYPYEVVHFAMKAGVDRAELMASTTGQSVAEMRPWLQDFNLGAIYGPDKVRAQIKATYDVGLDSWILWSPSNKYTKGALKNDE